MTRQKKEIVKQIDWLYGMIEADDELGCGMAPAGFYDSTFQEIYNLQAELARLSHYESVEAMLWDTRGCQNEGIPF